MGKKITFTKDNYDYLKRVITTGKYENHNDFLGKIMEGAVCCDIIILEDPDYEGEDYCYGGKYMIDCNVFLLGKNTGYGERSGIPYDCVSGYYGYLKDTYEETLDGIVKQFDELVAENLELKEGIANTELTWESVYKAWR